MNVAAGPNSQHQQQAQYNNSFYGQDPAANGTINSISVKQSAQRSSNQHTLHSQARNNHSGG